MSYHTDNQICPSLHDMTDTLTCFNLEYAHPLGSCIERMINTVRRNEWNVSATSGPKPPLCVPLVTYVSSRENTWVGSLTELHAVNPTISANMIVHSGN